MESILTSVKRLLGIEEDYEAFDGELVLLINSTLSVLNQLGVGAEGYTIKDKSETWKDFLGEDTPFEAVKSYVYMKVRLLFDPPQSSAHIESLNKLISEFEWRAYIHYDPVTTVAEPSDTV